MSDAHHPEPPGAWAAGEQIPSWMTSLTDNVAAVSRPVLQRGADRAPWQPRHAGQPRAAAVLILLSGSRDGDPNYPGGLPADAEILLTERAATLRQHSGQIAFPGGSRDPGDDFPVGTALREAEEETGLTPAGVEVVAVLPSVPVPPSGFDVTPVVAHWGTPSPVRVVDAGETARVARINMRRLLAPESRFQVRRAVTGASAYQGPAFFVDGMFIWGFTGSLIAAISDAAGWAVPWDSGDIRSLEHAIAAAGSAQRSGFPTGGPSAEIGGTDVGGTGIDCAEIGNEVQR